ncbi:MAG: BamA/TamA family outer membrane protein [Bacteroidia bacterium]
MLALVFLLTAMVTVTQAQSSIAANPDSKVADTITKPPKKVRKVGVLPVPAIGFAPETRLYFGAVALFTLRFWQDDSLTRLSSAKVEVNYTLNKQLIAETGWNLFTRGNKTAIDGLVGFRKFPENYWGIGAATSKDDVERVDMTRLEMEARGLRMLRNNLYLGLRLKLQNVFRVVADSGGLIETLQPPGYDGGLSLGVGPAFSWDTRDNPLNAKKGGYLAVSSLGFGRFIGSDFAFTRTEVDARKYLRTWPRHVLALQGYALLQTGAPPLRLLGLMGSDREMRGYYQGRYREQNYAAVQAEYRMPIWWRFGLAAWIGAGEVWNWNAPYKMERFKYTAGGGLRFLMDKKDNVNLRLDFGVGNGTTGFYVAFGEAF